MGIEAHGKDTRSEGNPLIAWGITGGEFYLREVVNLLVSGQFRFDLFLSRAGEELLSRYRMASAVFESAERIFRDTSASSPPIMRLFSGRYRLLVVAPATSNTVAKMACGIADTLVTNMFAQAGKIGIKSIVLPTDHAPVQEFVTVSGRKIVLKARRIDLENLKKLSDMEFVDVVTSIEELERRIIGS